MPSLVIQVSREWNRSVDHVNRNRYHNGIKRFSHTFPESHAIILRYHRGQLDAHRIRFILLTAIKLRQDLLESDQLQALETNPVSFDGHDAGSAGGFYCQ